MEKSKLPVINQIRTPGFYTSTSAIRKNIPTVQNPNRRDVNVHQLTKWTSMRRSKSVSDLRSLTASSKINAPTTVIKKPQLKTIPQKPPPTVASITIRNAVKRPPPTKIDATSAPKVSKPAKIPPYDYKARYNFQIEKNSVLQTSLKEKESQLSDIGHKYENITEQHNALTNNYKEVVKQSNYLQQELTTLKTEYETNFNQLSDLKASHKDLTVKVDELICLNKLLTVQKQSLEILKENLTKENEDLKQQQCSNFNTINEQGELISRYKSIIQDYEDTRRIMHNQIQDLKGTIRVFCRVRPPLPLEIHKALCHISYTDEDTIEIKKLSTNSTKGKLTENMLDFVFDKVFQPDSTQYEVFEELAQLIQSAMDGYNVCVFAYGQTGSGKTYTMQGAESGDDMGMIPRSVDLIFNLVEKYELMGWTYMVEVSFLEIYNETIRDLLVSNSKTNLEIKFNEGRGTTVANLTVKPVHSAEELHYWMRHANQNRAVAVTNYNEHSSRSHAVTKITLTGTHSKMKTIYTGSLSLVDLAGSESAKTSERMTETKNINKSLSALGTVMMALQNKENHVPYRNSKLTYLLQSSLGGNSKTLMFVNIAPLEECYGESVNALRFASNVKEVKIMSKKNKAYLSKEKLII